MDKLCKFVSNLGYTVIDKRDKGGALWVIGDKKIGKQINNNPYGIRFSFSPTGGRTTKYQSAWWTNLGRGKDL